MRKNLAIIICICLCTVCLGACGKSNESAIETAAAGGAGTSTESISAESAETTAASAAASSDIDISLIGDWQESIFDSGFIFNEDGTGTDTFWDLTFTYSCENGEVLIVYDSDSYGASKYTYSVSGDTLSMTRIDEEETSTFTYTKAD